MNPSKTPAGIARIHDAIEADARTQSALLSLAALIGGRDRAPELAVIDDVDELTAKVVTLFDEQVAAPGRPD
jgi:hypothetical protein